MRDRLVQLSVFFAAFVFCGALLASDAGGAGNNPPPPPPGQGPGHPPPPPGRPEVVVQFIVQNAAALGLSADQTAQFQALLTAMNAVHEQHKTAMESLTQAQREQLHTMLQAAGIGGPGGPPEGGAGARHHGN